jgi:aspartate kinase
MKFGGSSLSTGSRVKSVARIVERFHEGNRVAVVVSALGETTDRLVEIGEYARKGDLRRARAIASRLENSHLRIAKSVRGRIGGPGESAVEGLLQDLKRTVEGISQLRELTPRSRDYLLSIGERLSAPIVTEAFVRAGMKARSFTGGEAGISTDENFGEARPLQEVTFHQVRQRLDPLLTKGVIPVVTGFVGATLEGSITTLGRGGSDYTATLLGAALGADEVWIWTNVDGLMTADPRIVKNARILPRVSFGEALELSYFGAKMMHPRALQPAAQKKIPVRIKNTLNPKGDGTLVSADETDNGRKAVKAISMIPDVGLVTVGGSSMMGAPGVAAKVFQTLGSSGVNVMMISQGSSEATISCAVTRNDVDRAVRALQLALLGQGFVDRVSEEKDACIVAVVGSGMKGTPGVAARLFAAVAKRKVNVRMIAQGSSEYNVSIVVSKSEGAEAVKAIHDEFQLGNSNGL